MSRIYRATFKCHCADGTLMEPSVHYQTDVALGGSEPDPDDVASHIDDNIQAALRAILNGPDIYEGTLVREMVIPPDIGASGFAANGSSGNLVTGSDVLPRGVVPIINIHSGTASRSSRGHIAGPSPGRDGIFTSGRKWTTSYTALLAAFAAKLKDSYTLGAINPTIVNPVVYSRTRHLRDTPPFTFRVTSVTVNPDPHWLRSRTSSP